MSTFRWFKSSIRTLRCDLEQKQSIKDDFFTNRTPRPDLQSSTLLNQCGIYSVNANYHVSTTYTTQQKTICQLLCYKVHLQTQITHSVCITVGIKLFIIREAYTSAVSRRLESSLCATLATKDFVVGLDFSSIDLLYTLMWYSFLHSAQSVWSQLTDIDTVIIYL